MSGEPRGCACPGCRWGPGYWADAFEAAGARYTPLDADAGELALHGRPLPGTVMGDGQALPFRTRSFDLVYSSNVGEHVRHPWTMGDEMVWVCARRTGLLPYPSGTDLGVGTKPRPGTTSTAGMPRRGIGADRVMSPRTSTGRPCSRCPWPREPMGQVAAERGRGGHHSAVPALESFWTSSLPVVREILTWNVALILRKTMTVLDDPVRASAAPEVRPGQPIWRVRVFAVCLSLVTLAFLQDPGRIAADTKLDLTVDPWGFLGRSLHLWDPQGFFGQLQNQAYGYLWPMGPFFGIGDSLGLPAWVVQRLWWSLILVMAFLGMYLLLRALRVGSGGRRSWRASPMRWRSVPSRRSRPYRSRCGPWRWRRGSCCRWCAAPPVGTSPELRRCPLSWSCWPVASTPWRPVPSCRWPSGGCSRCNPAPASPVAGVVVRTHRAGDPVVADPVAGPGQYSPPFLDWIESAQFTTSITDPTTVLRGADHWLAYLGNASMWKVGWMLATYPSSSSRPVSWPQPGGGAGDAFSTAPGVPGRRRGRRTGSRHGRAHGVFSGLGSEQVQTFLDGTGAPLRNVHKFDLVLRIPLIIAMAHLLSSVWPHGRKPRWRVLLTVGNRGRVGRPGGRRCRVSCPVAARTWRWPITGGRPRVAQYTSPTRACAHRARGVLRSIRGVARRMSRCRHTGVPVGVRDAVPLSSAGNIRMLDAVEARLESGQPSPGLAAYLNRMGVRYLVVRNDLAPSAQAPMPIRVHQALDGSPGINRVAFFGPIVDRPFGSEVLADEGMRVSYPAVEIYRVTPSNEPTDPRRPSSGGFDCGGRGWARGVATPVRPRCAQQSAHGPVRRPGSHGFDPGYRRGHRHRPAPRDHVRLYAGKRISHPDR